MSIEYVAEIYIDLGEEIHVRSVVKPKCEQELPFAIRSARYDLRRRGGETEDTGECTINGHEIDAFIAPREKGRYELRYIYEVADETWVDVVLIRVE